MDPKTRNYPISEPREGELDARFNTGLWLDVAALLVEEGFPALTPLDLVELQQALARFIYKTKSPIRVLREIADNFPPHASGSEPGA